MIDINDTQRTYYFVKKKDVRFNLYIPISMIILHGTHKRPYGLVVTREESGFGGVEQQSGCSKDTSSNSATLASSFSCGSRFDSLSLLVGIGGLSSCSLLRERGFMF